MNYKGHLTGGIITSTLVAGGSLFLSGYDWVVAGVCWITTLIFSLYPDLDISSKPSGYAYIMGIPMITALWYTEHSLEALLLALFITIPKVFPHRGLVHTLKFGVLASLCWIFILISFYGVSYYFIGVASMLGFTTHLILDKHIRI